MSAVLKILCLISAMFIGQSALATPRDDAMFIAKRDFGQGANNMGREIFEEAFVDVYYKPIKGLGIEIVDKDKFADLIPDEDVAPYIERLAAKYVDVYLKAFSPEQLELTVAIMRVDKQAMASNILSQNTKHRLVMALEQARANAQPSVSDDPLVAELEDLVQRLDILASALAENQAELLSQRLALAVSFLFLIMPLIDEISEIEKKRDNPITIAAIKANGILRFANFTQRQNLLHQLSEPEKTGGIRFIKPPANEAQ